MNRPARCACIILALLLLVISSSLRAQDIAPGRAAWMHEARFGVMTHFLADWIARRENFNGGRMTVEEWNKLVDTFDVDTLAAQLESVGAKYYIITIGQNSGFYLAPNPTYDRIVAIQPSHCSTRDLVSDLYEPLHKRGIKLIVYLPAGAPSGDREAVKALQWQNGPHPNREFQQKWEQIIADWSSRWGDKVVGWWFDGCYWPNAMYRGKEAPNFESFAAAARAGNPSSGVAFNPGVVYRTLSITPYEDYIAGEIDYPDKWSLKRNVGGNIDGVQLHMLSFLGERWGGGSPRFKIEDVVRYTHAVVDAGGAVTWDVPIQRGGTIGDEFVEQLKAVGKAVREPTTTRPSATRGANQRD
jgi:hypothetical protein